MKKPKIIFEKSLTVLGEWLVCRTREERDGGSGVGEKLKKVCEKRLTVCGTGISSLQLFKTGI